MTMECAGNGRAHVEPHVVSQPWLYEAVGTARWRGVPVATVLEEAGVDRRRARGAVRRARPRRRGRRGAGVRAKPPPRATPRERGAARLRGQRRAASAAARLPAPAGGAGVVRDDEREVAGVDLTPRRAVRRVPDAPLLPHPLRGGRAGRADHDHRAAVADGAPGDPRVHLPRPHARARAVRARRSCVVGRRRDRRRRRLHGRRRALVAGASSATRRSAAGPGARGGSRGTPSRASTSSAAERAMRRERNSRWSRPGTSAATRTTPSSACASSFARSAEHEARRGRASGGEAG